MGQIGPMTPAQAFERVRPHLAAAGVTRVADITGLDRIGIPTFISVRPASRTLAVDSGKGVTIDAARASAAFESIERHVAETTPVPFIVSTLEGLEGMRVALNLPRVRGSVMRNDVKYRWAAARDVNDGGAAVSVPWQAVGLMQGRELPLAKHVWVSTSNGLASSTDYEGAVFQALCEVIERDACACHQYAGIALAEADAAASNAWMESKCFDPLAWIFTGGEPIAELLEKIHAAGCEVRCFDFTMADTLLPVVQCFLYEPNAPETGLYKGYGAHPDPTVALRRAITEAVQARCVIVAGARDDIDSETHARLRSDAATECARVIDGMHPTTTLPDFPMKPDVDWKWISLHLKMAGFPRVLVYDFGAHHGAHVVRVMVPGLAGYWTPKADVTERMRAFAKEVRQDLQD